MPRKITRAREIWAQLSSDDWDDDSWQALHRLIHSLAGSGAIYGFPMMGAAARALDIQLKAVVQEARARLVKGKNRSWPRCLILSRWRRRCPSPAAQRLVYIMARWSRQQLALIPRLRK